MKTAAPASTELQTRIVSIDAIRALTMLLMIWVNDFWTLSGVPLWLQHQPADADALGFSDVIFPAFLLIVGLSIPFALRQRERKGASRFDTVKHVLTRSFALLLMGFFMVNLESYDNGATVLPKALWQVLMTLAFFLIWNVYPRDRITPKLQQTLQASGCALLVALAILFRSNPSPSSEYAWMQPHWWGILGLIGWSYLICALIQLRAGARIVPIALAWLALSLFNILSFAGSLDFASGARPYFWLVSDGSLPALTMAGCLVSTIYIQFFEGKRSARFALLTAALGVALILIGFALRPYWGISKIQATPAWTQICAGLTLIAYAIVFYVVDLRKQQGWTALLRPAGVATLTCYLVPYLAYPLLQALPFDLPSVLTAGAVGLAKSLVFAFAIVWMTGGLNRLGVKLKI